MDDENEIYLCHKVTVRAHVISNIAYASIIVKSGLLSLVIKKKTSLEIEYKQNKNSNFLSLHNKCITFNYAKTKFEIKNLKHQVYIFEETF